MSIRNLWNLPFRIQTLYSNFIFFSSQNLKTLMCYFHLFISFQLFKHKSCSLSVSYPQSMIPYSLEKTLGMLWHLGYQNQSIYGYRVQIPDSNMHSFVFFYLLSDWGEFMSWLFHEGIVALSVSTHHLNFSYFCAKCKLIYFSSVKFLGK